MASSGSGAQQVSSSTMNLDVFIMGTMMMMTLLVTPTWAVPGLFQFPGLQNFYNWGQPFTKECRELLKECGKDMFRDKKIVINGPKCCKLLAETQNKCFPGAISVVFSLLPSIWKEPCQKILENASKK